MHLVFMTLEYFRIVALTFVQKILAGSVFNTKMGEKSKCKEKKERLVFSYLPSFFFIALFPTSSTNSRGNTCYAGYPREEVYLYLVVS